MGDLVGVLDSAVRADSFAILALHPASFTARILAGKDLRTHPEGTAGTIEVPGMAALLSGCGSGQIRAAKGPFHDDPFLEREGAEALVLACRDSGTERLVTLALRRRAESFTAAEKERFLIVSGVIHLMISGPYDILEHEKQSDKDPITGLGLYPAFHNTLEKEISRSRRRSGKICIAILQVTVGKGSGNSEPLPADSSVLLVADTLVDQLRNFDTVIRYSPSEFALILPEIGGDDAEKAVTRVADAVRSSDGKEAVVVHAGLSCYPEDGSTAERLIETAEAALNQAVEDGSGGVTRWKEG
jgi:diguanylate cyclase (GGDEF)-like protein